MLAWQESASRVLPSLVGSGYVLTDDIPQHHHFLDQNHQRQHHQHYHHPQPSLSSRSTGELLVESPRLLLTEKTVADGCPTSELTASLEYFEEQLVAITEKRHNLAKEKLEGLLEYVIPRMSKLANQMGLKILGSYKAGSTFSDTQVINIEEMDVFVLFERHKCKMDSVEAGYRILPLRRFRQKKGGQPDQWRWGRSEDGLYLSSMTVAKVMYDLLERALKLNNQVELEPFTVQDGKAQLAVNIKRSKQRRYRVNLIPASHVEREDVHLITRPYTYDENPGSDMLWRLSYASREKKILRTMDQADRGVRRRAFKILKALVKVEHTLEGLTSYHIKTALLHSFDGTVDQTPRWQRNSLEECFLSLLRELHHYLSTGFLPHFFLRTCNILGHVPQRTLSSLRMRTGFLLNNHGELVRILRKRAEECHKK